MTRSQTTRVGLCLFLAVAIHASALAENWTGYLTGTNVYVRSQGNTEAYPVAKLSKPAQVTVTGESSNGEFYQIAPAAGCYSAISSRYVTPSVQRVGGKRVGTVTGSNVRIWAAGTLRTSRFHVPQGKLGLGQKVVILGEARSRTTRAVQYYIIAPPKGVQFYVAADYVARTATGGEELTPVEVTETVIESEQTDPVTGETTGTESTEVTIKPIPTALTKEEVALEAVRSLEKKVIAESKKPGNQRDFAALLTDAQAIEVPAKSSFRPTYDALIQYIASELQRSEKIKAVARMVADAVKTPPLSPMTPVTLRRVVTPVTFDLVGELSVSVLYNDRPGGALKYVVRDPKTRKTLGRAQSGDPTVKLSEFVGEIVGLRGHAEYNATLQINVLHVKKVRILPKSSAVKALPVEPIIIITTPIEPTTPARKPEEEPKNDSTEKPVVEPIVEQAIEPVIGSAGQPKTKPEPKPEPKLEPKPEPKPADAVTVVETVTISDTPMPLESIEATAPKVVPAVEPKIEPKPESKPKAKPEATPATPTASAKAEVEWD